MSYKVQKVGHSELVLVLDIHHSMMYYHTKFGDPASNSIKRYAQDKVFVLL